MHKYCSHVLLSRTKKHIICSSEISSEFICISEISSEVISFSITSVEGDSILGIIFFIMHLLAIESNVHSVFKGFDVTISSHLVNEGFSSSSHSSLISHLSSSILNIHFKVSGFIVIAELHSSYVKELTHNFLIVQFSCSSEFS